MTTNEKIAKIRGLMKQHGVSAYVIPSADPHMSEYFSNRWKTRAYVSGFTGSAGTFVITEAASGLWTDGRYYVQAAAELEGSEATLFKAKEPGCPTVTQYLADSLKAGSKVGLNGTLFSADAVKDMQKVFDKKSIVIDNTLDLANQIWEEREPEASTRVYHLDACDAGKSPAEKLAMVREKLKEAEANALVISRLDCIAWLYNIRSNDVQNSPVVISYAFVSEKEALLFTDTTRVPDATVNMLSENGVALKPYDEIFTYMEQLSEKMTVLCDEKEVNYTLYGKVKDNESLTPKNASNPIQLLKARKNEVETRNTYQAYIEDGCAEVEFYGWLFEELEKGAELTEWTVSEKLHEFRAQQKSFRDESFTSIIAYRENAAMMHYAPKEGTAKRLEKSGLLLNDSGGQYLYGTTDTTRTVALGPISDLERRDFTLVLKAVIALSTAVFKEGTTGSHLDCLSRNVLWKYGLDYRCGTGHGVGYLLNVHEGPQGFGVKDIPFEEGMVLTIEPGIYTEGSHGIRTENTAVVVKDQKTEYGQFYRLDCFTVVPIDTACLDLCMMNQEEIDWLNAFQKRCYDTLAPLVSERGLAWLTKATQPVSAK